MSSDAHAAGPAIVVADVGKVYQIYDRPQDRLKQALYRWRRRFYREFWALRHVSFEVERGETFGIVGRNGAGKSTLLQIICGTLTPSEGRVQVQGRVAALLELGSGFNPEFTGRENVYMNGAILGLSRREIDARFDRIAGFADIGQFLDQPVKTYSSGMVVRLAFAVQVQVEPDVLIVDEALAVGDLLFQKRCFQRLRELREQGCTILFVSHDLESVRSLTSRAVFLRDGQTDTLGLPGDVLLAYRRYLHEVERRQLGEALPRAAPAAPAPVSAASPNQPAGDASPAGAKSFGDGDAEIVAVEVLDGNLEPCNLFYPGDTLVIRMRVRFHRALRHVNFSLRLRTREGVKVYSWGTLNQDINVWSGRAASQVCWDEQFGAGEEAAVEFRCPMTLGQNFYEVQAAVSEERDRYYRDQRMIVWRDEAAFFQVRQQVQDYFFGGLFDLRMTSHVVH
jgi:lipopolysaccharide transport system ATP-binding protein